MSNVDAIINSIPGQRSQRALRGVYDTLNENILENRIVNISGGEDYFVDGNRSSSGDGLSWSTAFVTLAEAITASNVSIAAAVNRWWARRNRIFVCGDQEIDEDLTVLPEKCDVIGTGADLLPFPRILGNHTIAVAKVATRFINCGFIAEGTGDLFVFPASCHGLQFLGCHFYPLSTSTKALEITSCAHVRIEDCTFTVGAGDMAKIFAVAISLEGTVLHDIQILNNKITATAGINVVEALAVAMGGLIQGNTIRAVALAIDDNSDDFQVVNNRWMTDINTGTSTAGYDFELQLACGNLQMGATGLCDSIPFVKIAE
jgi:hypothetical protein